MSFVTDLAKNFLDPGGAGKASAGAAKSSKKVSDLQLQMGKDNLPTIAELRKYFGPMISQLSGLAGQAITESNQYDPAQESQRALQAYDTAAQHTLSTDLAAENSGFSARGFSSGNASSDQNGAQQDVLARRASNRGTLAADLKMSEGDRKRAVSTNAFNVAGNAFGMLDPTGRSTNTLGALSAPANNYANLAQHYGNQAGQFDPTGLIQMGGQAIKGIKWPWEKKQKAGEYGDSL